jgi:hypothetical protein
MKSRTSCAAFFCPELYARVMTRLGRGRKYLFEILLQPIKVTRVNRFPAASFSALLTSLPSSSFAEFDFNSSEFKV